MSGAAFLQAVGRYDEALVILSAAVERRADFTSLGALAVLHAERSEPDEAERLFELSRRQYRGVAPISVALLDFQRGHMWMVHRDTRRARVWFTDAHRRLPCYVAAQGHLGEVEAMLGRYELAITLLRPLGESVEDPDYAAAPSRILGAAGSPQEPEACARKRRNATTHSSRGTPMPSPTMPPTSSSVRVEISDRRLRRRSAIWSCDREALHLRESCRRRGRRSGSPGPP